MAHDDDKKESLKGEGTVGPGPKGGQRQTQPDGPLYSASDKDIFESLMTFDRGAGAKPRGKVASRGPEESKTRAYSAKDMEHFDQLMSLGHVTGPAAPMQRPAAPRPVDIARTARHAGSDVALLEEKRPLDHAVKTGTAERVRSGAAVRQSAPVYSDEDTKNFQRLMRFGDHQNFERFDFSVERTEPLQARETTTGPREKDRKPMRAVDPGSRKTSKPLKIRRPGVGEIKLRYFD